MNIEERIETLQANIDALSAKFDKVLELLEGSNKVDANVKLALLIEKEDQNLKLNNQILNELKKLNEKIDQFEEEEEEFTPEESTQFMNQMFANAVANQQNQYEPAPQVEERITPNKETFETVDDVMNAQHDERKLEALRNMKFDTTAFNNILGGGSSSSVNLGEPSSTPSVTPSNPPPPPRQNVNYGPAEDPFETTFQSMNIPPVQSIPVQPVQPQRSYALKYNKGMDAFCAIRLQDNAVNEYPRGSIGYEYIKQTLKQNANGRQTAQLNMISDNNIMQIVNNIKQLEAQNAQQMTYQQPQQQVYQQGPTRRTMVSQQYNPMMYGMQQPVSITPPDEFIPAPPIGMGYEDYGNTNNSYTYNNYASQQQYGYNDPYALQPALTGNELNSAAFDRYFGSAMRGM
jgi:hypothetical protein